MKLLLSAGDPSADVYGALLIKEFFKQAPGSAVYANGGALMSKAGAFLLNDLVSHSVVGFSEAAKNYFHLKKIIRETALFAAKEKIDRAVMLDYPGFNLLLSAELKKHGIPCYYYVTPQVWAWGKGRIKQIKANFKKVYPILPFEKKVFEDAGVPAEFFGNPLVDLVKPSKDRETLRQEFKAGKGEKLVGLLPGSRTQEIKLLLPVMLQCAKAMPGVKFVLGQASAVSDNLLRTAGKGALSSILVVKDRAHDVLAASDTVIASSGTVCLEAAILGTPAVVIYKVSNLTWTLANLFIDWKFASLPNIIKDSEIYPELIQQAASPERIKSETERLLAGGTDIVLMRSALKEVSGSLGAGGCSEKVARSILKG